MARKRASMREGPLAELFRATEAAQRAQGGQQTESETAPPQPEPTSPEAARPVQPELPIEPEPDDVTLEATVEHVYDFELSRPEPVEPRPEPEPAPPPDVTRARTGRSRGGAGRRADPRRPHGRGARDRARARRGAVRAAREPLRRADAREPRRACTSRATSPRTSR